MSIQFNENFVIILKNYYSDLKIKLQEEKITIDSSQRYDYSRKLEAARDAFTFYDKLYTIMYNTEDYIAGENNLEIIEEVNKALTANTLKDFKTEINKILFINIIYKSYMLKSKDFHLNESISNLNFATMLKITTLSKRIFKYFVQTKMSEHSEVLLKDDCNCIPIKMLLKYYKNLFEVGLLFSIPQSIFPLTIFCLSHPDYNLCVSVFKEYMKDTKADIFKIGEVMSRLTVFSELTFADTEDILKRKGESYVTFETLTKIVDGIFTKYYTNSSKDKIHVITSELNNLRYDTMLDNVFSAISMEMDDDEDLANELKTFV